MSLFEIVSIALSVALFYLVAWLVRKFELSDKEPFKGHVVLSVNGETALVRVYDYNVVAKNPFPGLKAGDCVHVSEQGTGFAPYSVITHVYGK